MFSVRGECVMIIDYHFFSFLCACWLSCRAIYRPTCACWLPWVCLLISMCVPVDWHVCAFCMPEQLPHLDHLYACSLPWMRLLIAISVPVDCHMWACCGAEQLPHMGHFCASWMPCIGLLIAIYVPVDCHMWASCLPHRCLLSITSGPHVGQTTVTCGPHVGHRCKKRVAHMCALGGSHFNCHVWALCGPLVVCLLGRRPF